MRNLTNFTLNKVLGTLDNIGFMLLGTALALATGIPPNMALAANFTLLGTAALFLSFILGAIDAANDDLTIAKTAKKAKKKKRKEKAKEEKGKTFES